MGANPKVFKMEMLKFPWPLNQVANRRSVVVRGNIKCGEGGLANTRARNRLPPLFSVRRAIVRQHLE